MAQIIHNTSMPDDGLGDELRTAFGNQNSMNTELYETKVDKVEGFGLSENNFTDAQVIKLDGIEEGAQVNVPILWEDIIGAPEQVFSSVGYFHYSDSATQTTPLSIVANVNKKITNDGLGAQTNLTQAPYGVSTLFNVTTNNFDFSNLSIGDTLDLRVDLSLTTTSANQKYLVFLRVGEGSVAQYDLPIFNGQIKNISANNRIIGNQPLSIDYQEHIDFTAVLYILSDDNGSVKNNGFFINIIRKNVNIVSGGGGGSQDYQSVLDINPVATFTSDFGSGTLLIEEVVDDLGSIFGSRRSITSTDGLNLYTTEETINGNVRGVSIGVDEISGTTQRDFLTAISPTEGQYQENKNLEFVDLIAETSGSISYQHPTPKLGADVIIEQPYKVESGTYRIATLDDITGGVTDLSYTPSPTNGIVTSSNGTDATIPLANGTNAGLISPEEKKIIEMKYTNTFLFMGA